MNIRGIKKAVVKRYQKMEVNYGKKKAFLMGASYGLYRIFLTPVISLLKKDPYSESKQDHNGNKT